MASVTHCSLVLANSLQRWYAPSLQLTAARPLQRYLPPPLLTRRTPQQHGGLKPTASAADAADSDFPPFPKPPFKAARSPDWDERPAVVLPDSVQAAAPARRPPREGNWTSCSTPCPPHTTSGQRSVGHFPSIASLQLRFTTILRRPLGAATSL